MIRYHEAIGKDRNTQEVSIMLVLSRKPNEEIRIGNDIIIKVVQIQGGKVRIGVEAPKHLNVVRTELLRGVELELATS